MNIVQSLFGKGVADARGGFPPYILAMAEQQADAPGCSALVPRVQGSVLSRLGSSGFFTSVTVSLSSGVRWRKLETSSSRQNPNCVHDTARSAVVRELV